MVTGMRWLVVDTLTGEALSEVPVLPGGQATEETHGASLRATVRVPRASARAWGDLLRPGGRALVVEPVPGLLVGGPIGGDVTYSVADGEFSLSATDMLRGYYAHRYVIPYGAARDKGASFSLAQPDAQGSPPASEVFERSQPWQDTARDLIALATEWPGSPRVTVDAGPWPAPQQAGSIRIEARDLMTTGEALRRIIERPDGCELVIRPQWVPVAREGMSPVLEWHLTCGTPYLSRSSAIPIWSAHEWTDEPADGGMAVEGLTVTDTAIDLPVVSWASGGRGRGEPWVAGEWRESAAPGRLMWETADTSRSDAGSLAEVQQVARRGLVVSPQRGHRAEFSTHVDLSTLYAPGDWGLIGALSVPHLDNGLPVRIASRTFTEGSDRVQVQAVPVQASEESAWQQAMDRGA